MNMLDISGHIKCSECGKIRYGTGPYQCSNGHLICRICQPVLSVCPQCHIVVDIAVPIKCHFAVDILMDKIFVPCYYKSKGCSQEKMERWAMREHVSVCPFREYANGAMKTPGRVAEDNSVIDTGSGSEPGIANPNVGAPVLATQEERSGPAETNHHNEDNNPGLAQPTGDHHDEDRNTGVASSNHIGNENDATEEIARQDEVANAVAVAAGQGDNQIQNAADIPTQDDDVNDGVVDQGDDESHNAADASTQDEDVNAVVAGQDDDGSQNAADLTQDEGENVPDAAFQAENGNEGAMRTEDDQVIGTGDVPNARSYAEVVLAVGENRNEEKANGAEEGGDSEDVETVVVEGMNDQNEETAFAGGDNEPSSSANGDNGVNNEGNAEYYAYGSPVRSEIRYGSRKRQKTERYTALPFGPTRKRVKSEEPAPAPPPAPAPKPTFVLKAPRIQTRRQKILKKKVRAGRKKANKCSVCRRTFPTTQGLGIHMTRVHKVKRLNRYPCSVCKIDFPRKEHVAEHLANYHCDLAASCRNKEGILVDYHFCLFCIYVYEKDELTDHISTRHHDKF